VNAIRLQETPDDLVHAWAFLRAYYLEPRQARWYKRWKPSPPIHYLLVRDVGENSVNVDLAPRAFAKSTLAKEVGGLLLPLGREDYYTALTQATGKKVRKNMRTLIRQFENNARLNDDFGKEWGQAIKPKRGQRPWGTDLFELPNGSIVEGLSAQGALRGDRPDLCILDDPEYDEEEGTDQAKLAEDFETLLFATILPMLEEGCGLWWIGTAIPRSYVYYVVTGSDPRFKLFNRRHLGIFTPNGEPIWPEKWDDQTIADIRTRLGESKFQQEYMNNPTAGAAKLLVVHPKLGTYRVEGAPEREESPLASPATLSWYEKVVSDGEGVYVEQRQPFGEWASRLYRLMCVDFIRKPSRTSDYAAIAVLGFDTRDILWVLDAFMDRVHLGPLIRKTWEMARRWQIGTIGAEAVSFQEEMADQMASEISQMAAGSAIVPRVVPIRYAKRSLKNSDAPSQISKAERIAGLQWRFDQYRIRLPEHRRLEPAFAMLWNQIENFTMDLSLLRYDDMLDTVAMHQYMVRRAGVRQARGPAILTPEQLLRQGRVFDESTGLPNLLAMPGHDAKIPELHRELRKLRSPVTRPGPPEVTRWPQGPIRFSA